jgi:hypothetical protein
MKEHTEMTYEEIKARLRAAKKRNPNMKQHRIEISFLFETDDGEATMNDIIECISAGFEAFRDRDLPLANTLNGNDITINDFEIAEPTK